MSRELEKLREMMDESVYKKKRFTDKEMKELFQNVRSKQKRIVWIPQTLTVIFTTSFFLVGAIYLHHYLVDDEAIGWQQNADEGWEDMDSRLQQGKLTTPEWKNIHSSALRVPDLIGLPYLEDEEFLSVLRGPVRFLKSNGEDTLIRHRYTSGTDSSDHLFIEQWHTSFGSPPWLVEQMKQPEIKEIVQVSDTTIYLQNEGDKNIGFFSKGKLTFFVSGNTDIISLEEIKRILEKITEGKDYNRMIEYEGRP